MNKVARGSESWTPNKMGFLWGVRIFRSLATWFLLFSIVYMVEVGKSRVKEEGVLDNPDYLVPIFILMTGAVFYGTSLFALHTVKSKLAEKISEQALENIQAVVKLVVDIVVAIVLLVVFHFLQPMLGAEFGLSFAVSYLFWLCVNIVTWLLSGIVKINLTEGFYSGKSIVVRRSAKVSVVGAHVGLILLALFIFWYMSK